MEGLAAESAMKVESAVQFLPLIPCFLSSMFGFHTTPASCINEDGFSTLFRA